MKNLIVYTIVCLLLFSCGINRNYFSNSEKQNKNQIEALLIDTLEREIRISTESYWREKKAYYDKKIPVGTELEYSIRVSKESFAMIERDGGMVNIMRNILSKDNFDKLENYSAVSVNVMMSFDGSIVSGYCFSIRSVNVRELKLTQKEIDRFVDYFKQVKYHYHGNKFKKEIVPVGWTFPIRGIKKIL